MTFIRNITPVKRFECILTGVQKYKKYFKKGILLFLSMQMEFLHIVYFQIEYLGTVLMDLV